MSCISSTELILGGQKSGKSARAECLASDWLQQSAQHRAILIATALPSDEEMRARIARHQVDRAARVPQMEVVEEHYALAARLRAASDRRTLVVIDCLTLWLTNWLMPAPIEGDIRADFDAERVQVATEELLHAVAEATGPVVVVSNEIGLGVIPLGAQVRAFVDTLGRLNQRMAFTCSRVTFMAAGLAMSLKNEGKKT
jgi:adenosylcobinamide kinase / adenosylcobinamide-phosphate guanylyltransferase